ncbi:conserved Plasmodium membrane protein, unknown function [Plasmodium sp. DRC-Itaito]|nr:conserved Plasmodium membrane protein, unknown function [Plasmodium sp. DRC-Itaito]
MTIFLNSVQMVANVSCGEANTVITCFKKSIYDKYYKYIIKNITCLENYKHLESTKLKSKLKLTYPEYYFSSASETVNIFIETIYMMLKIIRLQFNIVTCLIDIYNNVYISGDIKHYFPNHFHHIAYASSPFVKINLNNNKTIKNVSISQNNIFLVYDDNSLEILGYNDYIDFFEYNHPIFFTNKHNHKHSYNIVNIKKSDFLVKQIQTGNNCAVIV